MQSTIVGEAMNCERDQPEKFFQMEMNYGGRQNGILYNSFVGWLGDGGDTVHRHQLGTATHEEVLYPSRGRVLKVVGRKVTC